MSLLALSGTNSVSTGYDIDNSLKVEPDNTEYLVKTPSSDGNRRTFTISLWLKRTELGAHMTLFGAQPSSSWTNGNTFQFGFTNDDTFQCGLQTFYVVQTNRVFRDTSAWYHVVVAVDTTQSTVANRFKLYINGVQETSWLVDQIYGISQNQDLGINHTTRHQIGRLIQNGWGFAGYIAEMHNVDGQQLAPTSFGEFDDDSGIWKPKAYTGTYGTNGFYLDFADAADLGDDESGNGNDYTENNITAADQATDTPTNSFCTLNPLSPSVPTYNTVSEGGTQMNSLGNAWTTVWSSVPLFKGKWYAEFKRTATNNVFIGAGGIDSNLYYFNLNYVGNNGNGTTFSVGLYSSNGDFYSGSGVTGSSYATNDILCLAVDQDNGAIYFRKNNDAWMGDGSNAGNPASGSSRTGAQIIDWGTATVLAASIYSSGDTVQANFGGYTSFSNSTSYSDELGMGSFVYEPPASYLAICTKNLAEYG